MSRASIGPNLSYRIVPRVSPLKQILAIISELSRRERHHLLHDPQPHRRARSGTDRAGVPARAYHAGLDSEERAQRQDLFIKDEIQVIVATDRVRHGRAQAGCALRHPS